MQFSTVVLPLDGIGVGGKVVVLLFRTVSSDGVVDTVEVVVLFVTTSGVGCSCVGVIPELIMLLSSSNIFGGEGGCVLVTG